MFIIIDGAISSYQWTLIILALALIVAGIVWYRKYERLPQWLYYGLAAIIALLAGSKRKKGTGDITLDELIATAGYSYDSKQDIFYSNMDAWQRGMGYCRLYDEAAAPLGMIIDCEPIYFEYEGKRWMIEFWKGQYDLTTGCELGVYYTDKPDVNIYGLFKGPFYQCADNTELLDMAFTLKKNGKTLFTRKAKHWWLTGFILGEFSEPSELTMELSITLKNGEMCNEFVKGLMRTGYTREQIVTKLNTVHLTFKKTHTPQPKTRRKDTDMIIQVKNKLLCDKYKEITAGYDNLPDKLKAVKEQAPELYNEVMNIGKTEKLFSSYKKIKRYID